MSSGATSYYTLGEIIEQPTAWRTTLADLQRQADAMRAVWRAPLPQQVIFTGCGSTFYLARIAAAIFQQTLGIPTAAWPASDIMLFPDLVLLPGISYQLVTLSRSGETSETIKAVEIFRSRQKGAVISITCQENAPLAKNMTLTLVARNTQEVSLAQTRSFSSMLIEAIAYSLTLANQPLTQLEKLPELGEALIAQYHDMARQLGEDKNIERFYFLGGGLFYGLACEGMLKMKEMSLAYSEGYHFLEFRHGPMAMVNTKTLIIGLVSQQATEHEAAVLQEMRKLGGRVLAVTPVKLQAAQADYQVLLPGGLTDVERTPLYLPAMQLLAYYRAVLNGCDPDKPNNLTMVVKLKVE